MSERSGTTAQMPSTRTTTTETAAQTSVRSILPNLPEPINGAMKAYDYSHRTFSRPYSAKTVFFYKEGDSYFTGLRVPVSKSRYRNIESLLDDLNSSISMPFGVRRLTTPSGKTVIHSIDQLQHLGRYIAATTNHRSIRPLDLDEIESIQRGRHPIRHHRKSHAVVSSNNESSHLPNAKLPRPKDNRSCGISRLPLTAKQILFVLNGKPSKIYRGILNPSRMKTFDSLLQEVSEGLQIAIFKLYTYDGKRITSFNDLLQLQEPRVLAVPRNERPNVTRVSALPRLQEFPMITQNISSKKTVPQAVSQRTPSPYADNSIERPNRIGSKHQRMPLTRANNKREKEKISTPETESEFRTVAETNSAKESSNKSKTISNEDDDSGRPQSNDELFLESGVRGDIVSGIEGSTEDEEEEGSESGIQVKIADDEMKHKRGSDTVSSSNEKKCEAERQKVASAQHVGDENEETLNEGRREGKDDAERKSEEEQKVDDVDGNAESLEKAAITIQSAYRGYRTRRNLKNKKLRFTAVDDHQDQEKAVSTSGGCPGSAQPVDENNAATVIQAQWRGYQTRKLFSTEGALPTEDKLMSQAEIDEIGMQQEAAMTIQSVWRGYRVRKQLKKDGLLPLKSQRNLESVRNAEDTSDDQEVSVNEYNEVNKLPEEKEAVAESEQTDAVDSGEADEEETTGTTYTVSILTGNRWAADTDNDLYITLYGNKDVSGKHYLRQETDEPKFRQNHMDSFHLKTVELGDLQKIVIGHEHIGYGAGVFIERVLVTENIANGRQYLFQCGKWFDSGQVDGKIERSLKVTAFYYLSSIPDDGMTTKGRWELLIYSGKKDGTGGTTSNLNVVGYGTDGYSQTSKVYDSRMATAPSVSLIQVDFGAIGELLKIRIEIDGEGDSPDFYIDHIELKDLDTDERMVSFVSKWLRIGKDVKNAQSYREIPVFRAAYEPLSVINYEGKGHLAVHGGRHVCDGNAEMQLLGELGDTGRFRVKVQHTEDGKTEVPFKTEAVSVGRIHSARLYVKVDPLGEEVYDGLSVLQKIFDQYEVDGIRIATSWLFDRLLIRESPHVPYRFVLQNSRVSTKPEDEIFKDIVLSEMEGLSTTTTKKKAKVHGEPTWILSMTIDSRSTLLPKVELCSDTAVAEMSIIDTTPADDMISFQQKNVNIGRIIKIRVGIDLSQRINRILEDADHQDVYENGLEIKRMKLYDSSNGDELRFPSISTIFTSESVHEFPAIWPDIPPIPIVTYQLNISSGHSSNNFSVYANIVGQQGDTGFRKLFNKGKSDFESNNKNSFEIEAVSVSDPIVLEIALRTESSSMSWKCEGVQLIDMLKATVYAFRFERVFTETLKSQRSEVRKTGDSIS